MKSTIKIGKIEYAGVKLEGVELSQEYTVNEAIGLAHHGKKFVQQLIKELPEMFEDMETAFNKFNEIDKRVEEKEHKAETQETEIPEDLKEFLMHMGLNPNNAKIVRGR